MTNTRRKLLIEDELIRREIFNLDDEIQRLRSKSTQELEKELKELEDLEPREG